MLAQIGGVQFRVAPFNFHEAEHEAGADFVAHPVVGAMPPLEFVGEANETWTLRGRMFPHAMRSVGDGTGGLGDMETLQAMRRSGDAHFFMRGDGVPVGWVVVEKVTDRSSHIDPNGVGKVIEFDITLKRSEAPNADGVFAALLSLFS